MPPPRPATASAYESPVGRNPAHPGTEQIIDHHKHWDKLTRFLEVAGAPLDNSICERALKKAILHRKNALFFKTQNGARVGDLFMSLIHTAELAKVDPFDYLTELQRNRARVAEAPQDWMPWNYRNTLVALNANASGTDPPP